MKKKYPFIKDCTIGFIVISLFLLSAFLLKNIHGRETTNSLIVFVAPYLFVPLLISVFHDGRYSCKNEQDKKKKKEKEKSKYHCINVVSVLLVITTMISMFLIYFGW